MPALLNTPRLIATLLLLSLFSPAASAAAPIDTGDSLVEDDQRLSEPLRLPEWFKLSFLDIGEDIKEANRNQRGLILYFGQEHCPYCKALIEQNWRKRDIVTYTRAHFDVVAIDIRGQRMVTGLDGREYTEKKFAIKLETNFTPTLLFFDKQGNLALRLAGFRPPYQFRAALEYVADGHYRGEDFRHYLARAEPAFNFAQPEINRHPAFSRAPLNLAHTLEINPRPLLVAFERGRCHACDVLHAGPLQDPRVMDLLRRLNAAQVDMRTQTELVTPKGRKVTADRWADELGLSYAPTLMFYDPQGNEILRLDSVVGFYRLSGVLDYIASGGYQRYPTYQQWRQRDH